MNKCFFALSMLFYFGFPINSLAMDKKESAKKSDEKIKKAELLKRLEQAKKNIKNKRIDDWYNRFGTTTDSRPRGGRKTITMPHKV